MRFHSSSAGRVSLPRRERGVVLFVALIVLVVMTLAGLALLRQMGAGTSIAGNVAFKENATSVADRGVEEARQWLMANALNLDVDSFANGYHSSWETTSVDPSTFRWDQSQTTTADQATTGNTTQYIIHRLCTTPGLSANDPAQRCSDSIDSNSGGSHSGGSYGGIPPPPPPTPFFRITARVQGPRGTVSYTQVLLKV